MSDHETTTRFGLIDTSAPSMLNSAHEVFSHKYNPHVRARILAHRYAMGWEKVLELSAEFASSNEYALTLLPGEYYAEVQRSLELAETAFRRCGSPIEEIFLAHCVAAFPRWPFFWSEVGDDPTEVGRWCPAGWAQRDPASELSIGQQSKIESFRIDFTIVPHDRRMPVAIELDGHKWHERTKEQAAKDKSRDRRLQELGWKVIRFTGSEIWKDPKRCVLETARIASDGRMA